VREAPQVVITIAGLTFLVGSLALWRRRPE
jgi:LPXTG-motif cell wall-anchored protein